MELVILIIKNQVCWLLADDMVGVNIMDAKGTLSC